MNKFIATVIAMVVVAFATLAFASPAQANGNGQPGNNKKVTICHATSSDNNPYTKNEVDISSIITGPNGHDTHDGDIIPPFTYTTVGGETKTYPGKGDQSLLAFPDCVRPVTDTEIAVPAVTKVDKCGTLEDSVSPVRDDAKYTTVVGDRVGDTVTVTFTAKNGFTFPGGKTVTVTVNFPNNDDCDLPETGGAATYNTTLGGLALAGAAMLGLGMMFTRKRI